MNFRTNAKRDQIDNELRSIRTSIVDKQQRSAQPTQPIQVRTQVRRRLAANIDIEVSITFSGMT